MKSEESREKIVLIRNSQSSYKHDNGPIYRQKK